ncbi:MAG: peptidoglycan D,D-transpeptidase FtsI family protein [Candidatus Paceibacteria bacterium]
MKQPSVVRIRIISSFFVVIGLLLISRLYYVQVVMAEHYEERAERQYVHTVRDLYSRGSIYFTTKDGEQVSAATVLSGYVLAINPTLITEPEVVYNALAPNLTVPKETFIARATLPDRTYVEIESRLSNEQADEVRALGLTGVMLYRNQWRYYPAGDVSARSIGFVGYSEDSSSTLHGRYGLERYYDSTLLHKDTSLSVNFFAEIFSHFGSYIFDKEETKTGDIVTTIEPTVARMLDRVLNETHTKYNSALTGGIIMDPSTGEIFALNSMPSYNLNDRRGATIEQFRNPLVENVYEMGSIVKALTLAAGLDSGVILPTSTYNDTGSLQLNTYTIRNFDGRARGVVSMQEVISQSLNTGVSHIVKLMGKERFRGYFHTLQLGSETGIDLPNEAKGLVNNLSSPRDVEYATASFGQGIATTPIATARALAALGNGGYMVTPHLVKKIAYDDGTERAVQYPKGAQVWSEETSESVSRMLTVVVDTALRGGSVALPNHTIAAKTGTAQIANPQGGYYDDRYLHSFFGYFPSYDPKFIVLLYTIEPKGVEYASETLTTPFMDVTKFLINYYNIPPDR